MKTKRYELTEIEVLALKMATDDYYHRTKHIQTRSPIVLNMYNALKSLKDQFNDDYRLWK